MHDRARQERQMRHQLPMNAGGDGVSLLHGQRGIDRDVHLREQLVSEPAGADLDRKSVV